MSRLTAFVGFGALLAAVACANDSGVDPSAQGLREDPVLADLTAAERADLEEANAESTAVRRLVARQRLADAVVARHATWTPDHASDLRSAVVERSAPEGDHRELDRAVARAAAAWVPTAADRELDERTRAEMPPTASVGGAP
jgi:hypothetical protein